MKVDPPGRTTAPDADAAQRLLLDGVRAFRAERYAEALDIFQRIQSAQQPQDIGFYLGMVLHKLGRHVEALSAFRAAHRGGLREPVADYYRAVSCYRLGLLQRARQDFQSMLATPEPARGAGEPVLGPRLQQGAQRFLQAVEQALTESDPVQKASAVVRRYEAARTRAETHLAGTAGEEAALEWLDEAVQLIILLPDRAEHLPALHQVLLRLREAVRGKPAEEEVVTLWARVSSGSPL